MLGRHRKVAVLSTVISACAIWLLAACVPATPVGDSPAGAQRVSVTVGGSLSWAAEDTIESGFAATIDERGLLATLAGTVEVQSEGGDRLRVTAEATLLGDVTFGSLTVLNLDTGRSVSGPIAGSPPVRVTIAESEDGSWGYTVRADWLSFDAGIQSGTIVLTVGHALPDGEPTTTTTSTSTTSTSTTSTSTTTSTTTTSTTSTTTTTSTTVPVGDPPVLVAPPSISGEPAVGSVLSVDPGEWGGTQPITFTVQFESCSLDGCVTRQDGTTLDYTPGAADTNRIIRATVTASNSAGDATATVDSGNITSPTLPVVNHCGIVAADELEIWESGVVHTFSCRVVVHGTVRVAPGAVLKFPTSGVGTAAFEVREGGLVDFDGTAAEPVVVTVLADDTVGGDSDGNGVVAGPPGRRGGEILIYFPASQGGSVSFDHVDLRWLSTPIEGSARGEVTIRNSSFVLPEVRPGGGGWSDMEHGWVSAGGCSGGEIVNSTFHRYGLYLNACDASLRGVTISNVPTALQVSRSTVSFRGTLSNVEVGISACNVRLSSNPDCFVDAAYSYWGSSSGPDPYGSGARVCGNVTAAPFLQADGSTSSAAVFGRVKNCDGTSVWDDANQRAALADTRLAAFRAAAAAGPCDPEILGDACDVLQMVLECLSAARQLALSNINVSLPFDPDLAGSVEWGGTFLGAAGEATTGITSAQYTNASTALGAAGGVGTIINVFRSLNNAYSQCNL